ncbi:DUF4442 domain-containing protein [Neptuniibacter sp. 1_MG-2023]|uniref:DUF4442 domain-containing protein n=1 Tax=Neptuniibacter sp. 1_MG-2023 TaxID=3062662 RepID=UPI0026E37A88|nr:DUF4442 domain-containing protein [Neptuniibacter sp. 1_MG-2023]MDO6593516.1 DUF4442 domain-containing protein [Neptuniibacter sp. 1_MG-2023]
MKLSARTMKHLFNLYPPYIGAGIKVENISDDWNHITVSMKVRWYNRNAVGTHFGGSIYSMIDPHIMLILMKKLGKEYWVWDSAAEIAFIKATKKKITAHIHVLDEQIEQIQTSAQTGKKQFPEFHVEIIDSDKNLIARVKKVLYVKRRPTL